MMINICKESNYGFRNGKSESWKPIKGYVGLYMASNLGRIKSYHIKANGELLKPSLSSGYLTIHLYKDGKRTHAHVHKLVAIAFLGDPPPPKYNFQLKKYIPCVANHKDGIKLHNYVENLTWATPSEDKLHAYALGLAHASGWTYNKEGEANPSAKLIEKDVLEIRRLAKCGVLTHGQLVKKFHVTKSTISRIIRRETWRHI